MRSKSREMKRNVMGCMWHKSKRKDCLGGENQEEMGSEYGMEMEMAMEGKNQLYIANIYENCRICMLLHPRLRKHHGRRNKKNIRIRMRLNPNFRGCQCPGIIDLMTFVFMGIRLVLSIS